MCKICVELFPTAFLLPLDCLLMPQINCEKPSQWVSATHPPFFEPTIDALQLLPLPTFNDNSVSWRCHMRHIPRLIHGNMRPSSSWKLRQDVDKKLITERRRKERAEWEWERDKRKRATTISRTRGDSSCDAVKCGTSFARRTRPVLNFWTNSKRKIWKRIMLTAEKSYNFLPRRQHHKAKAKIKTQRAWHKKLTVLRSRERRKRPMPVRKRWLGGGGWVWVSGSRTNRNRGIGAETFATGCCLGLFFFFFVTVLKLMKYFNYILVAANKRNKNQTGKTSVQNNHHKLCNTLRAKGSSQRTLFKHDKIFTF